MVVLFYGMTLKKGQINMKSPNAPSSLRPKATNKPMALLMGVIFTLGAITYGFYFLFHGYKYIVVPTYSFLFVSMYASGLNVTDTMFLYVLFELAITIFCIITIIMIYKKKKKAIRIAYITLGIILAYGIVSVLSGPQAQFYYYDEFGNLTPKLFEPFIFPIVFAAPVFIFIKNSKQISTFLSRKSVRRYNKTPILFPDNE